MPINTLMSYVWYHAKLFFRMPLTNAMPLTVVLLSILLDMMTQSANFIDTLRGSALRVSFTIFPPAVFFAIP